MPRTLPVLLPSVLVVVATQLLPTSIFPALVQDGGMSVLQLQLLVLVTALVAAVASPLWGLLLDVAGARTVLLAGLATGVAGLLGFGVVVTFAETLPPGLTTPVALVFRALLAGAGLAVLPVAALAVAGTSSQDRRTGAVGLVRAATDLGTVLGPTLGGALAVVSLALPLYAAPLVVVVVAAVLLVVVGPDRPAEVPAGLRPWQALPAFGVGALLHLALVLAQVTVTLTLVRDRAEPASTAGIVAAAATAGLLLTQGVLVPLLKPSPGPLMKIGAPVALAGYALLIAVPEPALSALGFLVAGCGTGLAVTGFAATASFAAGSRRQGLAAGLVTGTVGVAAVVASLAGSLPIPFLDPSTPLIAAGVAALIATGLALVPVGTSPVQHPEVPA